MKLRNASLIRFLGFLGNWLIRGWMSTVRYRYVFPDSTAHPADPRRQRYLYAFWHETILVPAALRAKIHVLISQHADGELIAQVCRHLGLGVVRGSSTRGGAGALLGLLRCSKVGHLAVTPDGPKGPRRHLKQGIIFLASCTGLPILPVGIGFTRAWRFRSWDRFALPQPWSTALCVTAPPIHVPARLNADGLEHYRRLVEAQFLKATEAAEKWAASGCRPKPEVLWGEAVVRKNA
jgi:lysophospholipid acyltransferase (LPLAT)-like uncharacterized protein